MIRKSLWSATFAALVLLAACAGQKEPATQALASVEASLAELRDDGTRFAKEQLDAVEGKVTELKARFERREYKEVVAGTNELQPQIAALKADVETKRGAFNMAVANATASWTATAATLPGQIEAVEKRIEQLVKSRRMKAESEERLRLDEVKNLWSDSNNLLTSEQQVEAAVKADEAKTKLAELAGKMKVKL